MIVDGKRKRKPYRYEHDCKYCNQQYNWILSISSVSRRQNKLELLMDGAVSVELVDKLDTSISNQYVALTVIFIKWNSKQCWLSVVWLCSWFWMMKLQPLTKLCPNYMKKSVVKKLTNQIVLRQGEPLMLSIISCVNKCDAAEIFNCVSIMK